MFLKSSHQTFKNKVQSFLVQNFLNVKYTNVELQILAANIEGITYQYSSPIANNHYWKLLGSTSVSWHKALK